eukprot:363570-Chlamydomonas_euryale.AAC.3
MTYGEYSSTTCSNPASLSQHPPTWRVVAGNLLAGAVAGCAVETALYPIDTIKTRLQVWWYQEYEFALYLNPSIVSNNVHLMIMLVCHVTWSACIRAGSATMAGVQCQGHRADEAAASRGHSSPPRKIDVITLTHMCEPIELLHSIEQILHLILAKRPRKVCMSGSCRLFIWAAVDDPFAEAMVGTACHFAEPSTIKQGSSVRLQERAPRSLRESASENQTAASIRVVAAPVLRAASTGGQFHSN